MHTSLHTSVRRVAVKSLISLCLIDGKPPLAHDKACSTEKEAPQAHFDGCLSGVQPYCSARASWKAPLCSAKLCSVSGKTVSQVEDPFSLASFTDLCRLSGRRWIISRAAIELFSLYFCFFCLFLFVIFVCISHGDFRIQLLGNDFVSIGVIRLQFDAILECRSYQLG